MGGNLSSDNKIIPQLGDVNLADLPPFLRVLMTTDGTVTKSLEAFFGESITVEPLFQKDLRLEKNAPFIERQVGDVVMSRMVQLRGLRSDNIYVKAESLICAEMLPESFQQQLKAQRLGIGELLLECGLETYREILQAGLEKNGDVWRTYRIAMEHRPFIQITEHFPVHIYQT